ncbi:dTDP-4-dehydrorhamnose reductase [Niabella drilacis]|uniref:dTDP-4-dehydrorhamnose reductase n=1 Tax=Niabella drilacis (strain DSM 25811 / CCM 8410 / CCUG 62505 / LMG 26954 / E90) TaxID=1285928 RepID=A0A1G6UZF5_NIADE|nr:dTDP-4-dehydrorhamnose reductase [Niabella drilacis]SDD46729.1 dTDP-4-dehydrorhamnose reductase [Niabella drilacis]
MEQPVKILVTGSNGQLGSELRQYAGLPGMIFDFTERATLQLTNEADVREYMEQVRPQYVINGAAYTAVDKAEETGAQEEAEAVNARAVGYLAKACTAVGAKLVHISTDYVFDGTASQSYKPSDHPNPVSVYGATKLKGEELAERYTDAVILRTAWVYSSFGKNFVKTMIRLMAEKPVINVVADQYGSPTYAADLAAAIISIIQSGKWVRGIYHYTNEGETSWYEFAGAIRELIHSTCMINPIPTADYPTPARRPAYSVLDKTGIKETYGIIIPAWRESLEKCISKLQP